MEISGKQTYKQFTGRYYHLLDSKHRISVPALFRKGLSKEIVLTRGFDGCLFLFSQKRWEELVLELQSTNMFKKLNRDISRLLLNSSESLSLDSLGRILVPDYLLSIANLKKDVVFAGSGDRIEVWNRDQYHAYLEKLDKSAESIAEEFGNSLQPIEKESHA